MPKAYMLVTWSDFARGAKDYASTLAEGVSMAVTVRGKIVALIEPYENQPVSVYQERKDA